MKMRTNCKLFLILLVYGFFIHSVLAQTLKADSIIKLDINSADITQLADQLPGIGPAKAQRIVQWRIENGPFTKIEDLILVKGIGPKTLNRLRSLIRLGGTEQSRKQFREQERRHLQAQAGVRSILSNARKAAKDSAAKR